jgi:type I restriction enzyme R subunit
VKPHGFVIDFVGIFDKLEKALAFDSDEVNAIVKNLELLKQLFGTKIEGKGREYVKLIEQNFNDKDVDNLIEHFRDKGLRKELFKEYKDSRCLRDHLAGCLLRPYMETYATSQGFTTL